MNNTSVNKNKATYRLVELGLEMFDGDGDRLLRAIRDICISQKEYSSMIESDVNIKKIKVFDIDKLNEIERNLLNTERSMRAILNKFNLESDTGYRQLKGITKKFTDGIRQLKLKYPNCSEFLDMIDEFGALPLCRKGGQVMSFPPILLTGPPGVGKTAVVCEVAKILEVDCRKIDFASVTSGFVLSGLSTAWSDAKAGCIVDILREGKTANSILILDEIDKVSGDMRYDPLGALYSLLEKDAAKKFVDEALDIPIDASHLLFVATANNLDNISGPIRSRFTEIPIKPVERRHHKIVTQSIYKAHLAEEGLETSFAKDIHNDVFRELEMFSPREVKLMLLRAVAKAARRAEPSIEVQVQIQDFVFPEVKNEIKPVGFVW